METLIQRIQESVNFKEIEPRKIVGFKNTIFLKRYEYVIETKVANLKMVLSEMHENNQPIKNLLRLSITEDFDDTDFYDAIDLRHISEEKEFFEFIHFISDL